MQQLHRAAQQEDLGPADEKYWLKNGVPLFFDPSGPLPVRWNAWDVINFFSHKLHTLRNQCDRLYAKQKDRPKMEVFDLIFAVAHLHMSMVKKARDAGEKWPGRLLVAADEARLPIWGIVNTILSSSIGKRKHGYEMRSGVTYDDDGDHIFTFSDRNLLWDAQATNMGKAESQRMPTQGYLRATRPPEDSSRGFRWGASIRLKYSAIQ
jgi:hypothetical protein